jgi:hypothetical protein
VWISSISPRTSIFELAVARENTENFTLDDPALRTTIAFGTADPRAATLRRD